MKKLVFLLSTLISFSILTNVILALPNPAAVYCTQLGYNYNIIKTPQGEYGECIFPDNSKCEEWQFLEGKCGQEYSYCKKNGYNIKTVSDGKNPYSYEYAVCTPKKSDQKEIVVTDFITIDNDLILPEKIKENLVTIEETHVYNISENIPSYFDWRNVNGSNWLTPVKEQGRCGSCWDFAAVGTVEAKIKIESNNPSLNPDLSEQDVLSCDGGGCIGGHSEYALDYIKGDGVVDEQCFPYTATDETCLNKCSDWKNRAFKIVQWSQPTQNEDQREILVKYGPLPAYIAWNGGFDSNRIYRCNPPTPTPNHMIILVGYNDTGGYWIAKNTNGDKWNGDGYFKVYYYNCHVSGMGYVFADPHLRSWIEKPTNETTVYGLYRILIRTNEKSLNIHNITNSIVSKVEVSINNTPYIDITSNFDGLYYYYDWDVTALLNQTVYTIDVIATDNNSQIAHAPTTSVIVDNVDRSPSCNITTPAESEKIPRTTGAYKIIVYAKDDRNLKKVEVSIDSGNYVDITSNYKFWWQYTYWWDVSSLSVGPHTINARATDDALQVTYSYVIVNVTPSNPPTIFISHPSNNSVLSGTSEIAVWVMDDAGNMSKVEVSFDLNPYIDITNTQEFPGSFNYYYNWSTEATVPNGLHKINARAADNDSLVTFAEPRYVYVNNTPTNQPVAAIKGGTNGYFYIPRISGLSNIRVDLWGTNASMQCDQAGGNSPYVKISSWPDGKVDISDGTIISNTFNKREGDAGWNYMADCVPDRIINFNESTKIESNIGNSGGNYLIEWKDIKVKFNNLNYNLTPGFSGLIRIPVGAVNFTVYNGSNPVMALVTFYVKEGSGSGGCGRCFLVAIGPYIMNIDTTPLISAVSAILFLFEIVVLFTIWKKTHLTKKKRKR